MNISFDLDNTLIPSGNEFEIEHRNLILRLLGIEKIRKGTKQLIDHLQREGHQVHIYTTSYRSKSKIRRYFLYYGIKVGQIVNERENRKVLYRKRIQASKYPPAFNFDIHIDDSKGVELEGALFNFNVIVVKPSDFNWVQKIQHKLLVFKN